MAPRGTATDLLAGSPAHYVVLVSPMRGSIATRTTVATGALKGSPPRDLHSGSMVRPCAAFFECHVAYLPGTGRSFATVT